LFSCDCGVQKELIASDILKGSTKSCGCLRHENSCISKHRGGKTRLYSIWKGMRSRCMNENDKDYKNYGGRGIKICEEWSEFVPFRDWALNNGYQNNLTIDRTNNNGNYEPSNTAWKNLTEQARNRRNTVWYDIEGVNKPLIEWCQILNVKYTTAFERHRRTGVYFLQQELQPYLGRS